MGDGAANVRLVTGKASSVALDRRIPPFLARHGQPYLDLSKYSVHRTVVITGKPPGGFSSGTEKLAAPKPGTARPPAPTTRRLHSLPFIRPISRQSGCLISENEEVQLPRTGLAPYRVRS